MLVRELMTSPAVSVQPEDEVAHAITLLDQMNVTCLPVVDGADRICGLVGEADLIRQIVDADDQVAWALALMNGTGLKSVPVVLHERVVGMLSRRDVIRALARGDLEAGDCELTDA